MFIQTTVAGTVMWYLWTKRKRHTLQLDLCFTILYTFEFTGFSGCGANREAESVDWSSEYESCAQPALSTPSCADTSADTPGLDDTLKLASKTPLTVHNIFEKLRFWLKTWIAVTNLQSLFQPYIMNLKIFVSFHKIK